MTAEYQVHGDIAVISLNNPPVNGLGFALRNGVALAMDRALADAGVQDVVAELGVQLRYWHVMDSGRDSADLLARWLDGRSVLWLGQRKQVGRGEGSSGLRFDRIDDPSEPTT